MVATPEPDHPLRRVDYLERLVEGQAETFECRLKARDGREFWVVGNAVVTGRGAPSRQLTFALLDIERRRQAEKHAGEHGPGRYRIPRPGARPAPKEKRRPAWQPAASPPMGAPTYSMVSRCEPLVSFFGRVRVSTPLSYFALACAWSMSIGSWKLRDTAPK